MQPRTKLPRTIVPIAAVALSLLALAAPGTAHAAASCSFDAAAAKVSVDYSGLGVSARISRTAAGAIQLDGANCGTATVSNTDTIQATAGNGLQQLVIDLAGGALAPGKTAETTSLSEIEITVDGGTGLEFPLGDEVRVNGGATPNTIHFTDKAINLNGDGDTDVTTAGIEAMAAEGNGGDDQLLGTGVPAAALPLRLAGGPGDDVLAGGDADDILEGGADDDIETGNNGRDTFRQDAAANGADTLDGGGSPFDRIDYSQRTAGVRIDLDDVADDGETTERDDVRDSVEYIAGGEGPDTIVVSQRRFQSFDIAGNGGDDTITGGSNFDRLDGGEGGDTLKGNDGSDTFVAGNGDDKEYGDAGADTFHEGVNAGPNGADDINGGIGIDQYNANERTQPLTITVGDGLANDGAAGERDSIRVDVETITAGQASDTIGGSPAANLIHGGAGDDRINGNGGDDEIYGRNGTDTITGGAGKDKLYGNEDADTIDGGTEDDEVRGGDAADTLRGGTGADRVFGERQDDRLFEPAAPDGGDALTGGDGIDSVSYGLRTTPVAVTLDGVADDGYSEELGENDNVSAEEVIGGNGDDVLTGSPVDERLIGGPGHDDLSGGGGKDFLFGADGADDLLGGGADDTLNGGADADRMVGEDGEDLVSYEGRTESLVITIDDLPNDGADGEGDEVQAENVVGGQGHDRFIGDRNDNELDGRAGNDTLDGHLGADVLEGGEGTDVVTYGTRTGRVAVSLDGVARDGADTNNDKLGEENDNVMPSVENLLGGDGGDYLEGSAGDNNLNGSGGNDALEGGKGADVLDGQAGNADHADYGARTVAVAVTADGEPGDGEDADGNGVGEENDNVTQTTEWVSGGAGNDRLIGGREDNSLQGNGGDDFLAGGWSSGPDGNDFLNGGDGERDTVSYDGRSLENGVKVTLDGAANDGARGGGENDDIANTNEIIVGGWGDDQLTGNDRAQTLNGGTFGNDLLQGLGGDDVLDESRSPRNPGRDADELAGGEGHDVVDYSGRKSALQVTIDNFANDGIPERGGFPGEHDNVLLDVESVIGGTQGDLIAGSADADELDGRGGQDRVFGLGGKDVLLGGNEVDRIYGGQDSDEMHGGEGNDVLTGDAGHDTFVEEPTWPESGNDGFNGGAGYDTVDYGARAQRVVADNDGVTGDDGQDADHDGTPEEKDRVGSTVEVIAGGSGPDVLTQTRRDDDQRCNVSLYGGPGGDLLIGHDGDRDFLHGGDGDDTLNARGGDDYLEGGMGADAENGGDGRDHFIQGRIFEDCTGWTHGEISGSNGGDTLTGGDGEDQARYDRKADTDLRIELDGAARDGAAGEGDNVKVENVSGGRGDDLIIGDGSENTLGGAEGDDQVEGKGSDDELWDNHGTDWLFGGDGDDRFEAKDGDNADHLIGGGDSDSGEWDEGDILSTIP